ncbi:hypothetical protein PVAND_015397 [Polypedilum vanderplanki]|uniref:GATA zinc finger domain-containing protein 1 n=1 Tax=Polypedilum vanderplanki TaxID=319348 RepID=A0A9J6BCX1_POLVA|nr:hypothetical protein PVAND_015397 [Polypedilum vanderplanki]
MNPKCIQCDKTESILWRKNSESAEICNDCFEANLLKVEEVKEKETVASEQKDSETPPKELEPSSSMSSIAPTEVTTSSKVRKSTRSTRFKSKAMTRQKSTKSTSRRSNVFKSSKPFKTPNNICAETKTKTNLFHDGFYYQIGDIVSVMSRGKKYYAQIRALMVDSFCEKSAVLTWLIPTTSSPDPNEGFDPATYLIGLEEDLPRRIANIMEFVMHAPSNYYYNRNEPYEKPEILEDGLYSEKNKKGFVWTNMS